MRTKLTPTVGAALLSLLALLSQPVTSSAQGTAFTYQGRLSDAGAPANGVYDLEFRVFDMAGNGAQQGGTATANDQPVTNGLFTVILDFGSGVFDGNPRWLQIAVRPGASTGSFTNLVPRQPITAAPYAILAGKLNGPLPSANLSGTYANPLTLNNAANSFTGNGAGLTGLSAGNVSSGTLADARLSTNVALRAGGNTFSGAQIINGNVGIGTNAPQAKLHVSGGNIQLDGSNELFFADGGEIRSFDPNHRILFRRSENRLELREYGDIIFSPGSLSGNETAKAVIVANGNVGIGTTTPGAKLEVAGPSLRLLGPGGDGTQLALDLATYNPGGDGPSARLQATDRNYSADVDLLTKQPGASSNPLVSRLHIDSSTGNVGIGTNNPHTALQVTGIVTAQGFAGNGASLSSVNALTLEGVGANGFWRATGNAGTSPGTDFLGTTDDRSLELKVGGARALRLEPHGASAASLAGGYFQNSVAGFHGATIAGGGTSGSINEVLGDYAFVGAGHGARAGNQAAVVGGAYNSALGRYSFVGTGLSNSNLADYAFLGSGSSNLIQVRADRAVLAGGDNNVVETGATSATISGGAFNRATGPGSTVGGGGNNAVSDFDSTISGGANNIADANAATISGGSENRASGDHSTIGGGQGNVSGSLNLFGYQTVGGGSQNTGSGHYATVGGGAQNTSSGWWATVGGGANNTASGPAATVPGGVFNVASGDSSLAAGSYSHASGMFSTALGDGNLASGHASVALGSFASATNAFTMATGRRAKANHQGSFVWADSQDYDFASTAEDQFSIRAMGGFRLVGGPATLNGRTLMTTESSANFWQLGGNYVGPGQFLGSANDEPVEFKVNGVRALRLEPTVDTIRFKDAVNVIGGSPVNTVAIGVQGGTIAGGGFVEGSHGGAAFPNTVIADLGTVGGGAFNTASGLSATVGGGYINISSGNGATVGGGLVNDSGGNNATVGGGSNNSSSGDFSTVPGGDQNSALGNFSFAAGFRAKAAHDGSFVWADSQGLDFESTADNQFSIRAGGGLRFNGPGGEVLMEVEDSGLKVFKGFHWSLGGALVDNQGGSIELGPEVSSTVQTPFIDFHYSGVINIEDYNVRLINDGNQRLTLVGNLNVTGTITPPSDRNVKAGFAPVDPQEVLAKVAALPITRWHYTNDTVTPHLGPVAQDFHAAFGLGADDKHIATVDADGVALAAIQGLNQKLEEKLEQKETEITELKQRLEKLERLLNDKLNGGEQ